MSTFLPPSLHGLATHLFKLLTSKSQTVCLSETATGGLLSSSLLSLPGASKVYRGGLVLYTLESRLRYAGWTQEDISNYRGPTIDIVTGLATRIRSDLDADWCLAESGTAGPTGGNTSDRTPGYVALAVVGRDGKTVTKEVETGSKERTENMLRFAEEGLRLLIETIESGKSGDKL